MKRPPRELLEFLHWYNPAIQSLALGLRTVVHEEMTPSHEYIFQMRSKVVLLYPYERTFGRHGSSLASSDGVIERLTRL
jgi:hypothetical protein